MLHLLAARSRTLILIVIAILSGASVLPVRAQKMPTLDPRPGVRVGDLARDFSLKDLDGETYQLSELRGGKVVQVVFWATWCIPCVEEIPKLRKAYEKYRVRGFEVLGIVVPERQTRDGVRAFAEKFQINYPILWDEGMVAKGGYRVGTLPKNFLVGRDGIIRHAGVSLPEEYEALLERLLNEEDPTRTATR